jgi:hypothetical protein
MPTVLLTDDFPGAALDTGKWSFSSTDAYTAQAVSGGKLKLNLSTGGLATGGGVTSVSTFSLSGVTGLSITGQWNFTGRLYATSSGICGIGFIPPVPTGRNSNYGTPYPGLWVHTRKQSDTTTRTNVELRVSLPADTTGYGVVLGSAYVWPTAVVADEQHIFELLVDVATKQVTVKVDGTARIGPITLNTSQWNGVFSSGSFKVEVHHSDYATNVSSEQWEYVILTDTTATAALEVRGELPSPLGDLEILASRVISAACSLESPVGSLSIRVDPTEPVAPLIDVLCELPSPLGDLSIVANPVRVLVLGSLPSPVGDLAAMAEVPPSVWGALPSPLGDLRIVALRGGDDWALAGFPSPEIQGYQYSCGSGLISTEMQNGYVKRRRRWDNAYRKANVSFEFPTSKLYDLEQFLNQKGYDWFNMSLVMGESIPPTKEALYFYIDMSGSMSIEVSPGRTRLAVACDTVSAAISSLMTRVSLGALFLAVHVSAASSVTSLTRRWSSAAVTPENVDDLYSWLTQIAPGVVPSPPTAYRSIEVETPVPQSILDALAALGNPARTSGWAGVFASTAFYSLIPTDYHKAMFLLSDGEYVPETEEIQEMLSVFGTVPNLNVYGIQLGDSLTGENVLSALDNTPGDGVPKIDYANQQAIMSAILSVIPTQAGTSVYQVRVIENPSFGGLYGENISVALLLEVADRRVTPPVVPVPPECVIRLYIYITITEGYGPYYPPDWPMYVTDSNDVKLFDLAYTLDNQAYVINLADLPDFTPSTGNPLKLWSLPHTQLDIVTATFEASVILNGTVGTDGNGLPNVNGGTLLATNAANIYAVDGGATPPGSPIFHIGNLVGTATCESATITPSYYGGD